MSTVRERRLFSEAEYLLIERQAPERSEYYQGEIYAMAGAAETHEIIAGNCFALLWNALKKRGCEVFKGGMKVYMPSASRFCYPDVVVVCGQRQYVDERKDALLNPNVIIEVFSPSTEDYDRGRKLTDYRSIPTLMDILLVAQDQPQVDRHSRQSANTWAMNSTLGLNSTIELASVGCTLGMTDIYAGVEFKPESRPPLRVARNDQA